MMKEYEFSDSGAKNCFFIPKVDILFYPKVVSCELRRQYSEYGSPANIKRVAVKVAETFLFHSIRVEEVGLAGSLARETPRPFSDIDLVIFTNSSLARKFAYQTGVVVDQNVSATGVVDLYTLIGVQEAEVVSVLSFGIPVSSNGVEFKPVELHPFLMSDRFDPEFVRLCERFNPRVDGLSCLASLGKDFLIFEPLEGRFKRPESHWLVDLYKAETGLKR